MRSSLSSETSARMAALALRAFPEPSRKCNPLTGCKSPALVQVETGMEVEVACEFPKGARRSVVEPEGDPGLLLWAGQ
jgi:hypothetical protein